MKYYIGIDLGGTNIKAGVVTDTHEIIAKESIKTNFPRTAEQIADDMAAVSRTVCEKAGISIDDVEWVGIGTPGTVDTEEGIIEFANNLNFHFVPMRKLMEERLGKKVYLENDANAAAFGEAVAGVAKGAKHAIGITLGTGVGGGIIIDGKIYGGYNFAGAELGHMVVEYEGRQCTCGRKGCIEAYASATGLINMTKEYMAEYPDSYLWELCGGNLDNVSGKDAFIAQRKGDEAGRKTVEKYIGYLGCGLASFVNIFQPEILFIGGGVCNEGEALLAPLRKIIEEQSYCVNESRRTKLVVAKLGNDAGIIGAALMGGSK